MSGSSGVTPLAVDRFRISTPALQLSWFAVPWDSAIFGEGVAQIEGMVLLGEDACGSEAAVADFEEGFERWCHVQKIALVACKLDHMRLRELAWLQGRGFRFIETMLYPRLDGLQERLHDEAAGAALEIKAASGSDRAAIESIAASAFATSRFFIDPWIPVALGAERYRVWVGNSLANPAHQVLKATLDGSLVGFFVVEQEEDGAAYWHLTAVAPEFHGRGFGKALWGRMIRWHAEHGANCIETAVSGHNLPVLGLYGRLGFRFARADVTLHRGALRRNFDR